MVTYDSDRCPCKLGLVSHRRQPSKRQPSRLGLAVHGQTEHGRREVLLVHGRKDGIVFSVRRRAGIRLCPVGAVEDARRDGVAEAHDTASHSVPVPAGLVDKGQLLVLDSDIRDGEIVVADLAGD